MRQYIMRKTYSCLASATLFVFLCASLTTSRCSAQGAPDKLAEVEKQLQALQNAFDDLRRERVSTNQASSTDRGTALSSTRRTNDLFARIREEGLERSQVMETLSYLTDVIGPRLTGSPNLKRANEWTRDKLTDWGLTNAHLEAWGPFGRGWSLKRFSAQIIEPQGIPLAGYPKAWSPGLRQSLTAPVVYLDAKEEADLDKCKGKLKGAIVLSSPTRELKPRFEPLAVRMAETNLLRLANATAGESFTPPVLPGPALDRARFVSSSGSRTLSNSNAGPEQTSAASSNSTRSASATERRGNFRGRPQAPQPRFLSFAAKEGAALIVTPSSQGDGGTFFVSAASVPGFDSRGTNGPTNAPKVWSTNVPAFPPQITMATEDYNRLVRMIQQGEKLKMTVDLQVQFHDNDLMAYNTIAEIPGRDLKDEIVMLGAHMDSWHSGTGATDNGAGVAAAMEAVRILMALKLEPRRTIRIGLWSGEEQGLLGSHAYVSNHFGYHTNLTNTVVASFQPGVTNTIANTNSPSPNSRSRRSLVKQPEYDQLSAYFNLDNGGGKIRGVYMQGNEAVRPLFRRWLRPFLDLEAETLTVANTGGTDHLSFDGIGLPGFQFIQDPLDYSSRTHHSNEDVFDRISAEDLKQAATILAAFVYNTAMLDEKLPRKPAE